MNRKTILFNVAGIALLILQFFKYYYGHFAVPSCENAPTYSFEYAGYIIGYNIFAIFGLIAFMVAYKLKRKYNRDKI